MGDSDDGMTLERRVAFLEHENALLKQQKLKLENLVQDHERRHVDLENRLSIDAKTGLPNHHRLSRELQEELETFQDGGSESSIPLAIAIVKLDGRYDLLAKTMKPSVSEWVLYQTGQRLLEEAAPGDTVYNTREDEFVLVMRNLGSNEDAIGRTIRAIEAIARPHVFSGYHVSIGAKAGLARFPDHGLDKGRLLYCADIALEHAKVDVIPACCFEERMRETAVERMDLQNAIIRALEAQAIEEISRQFQIWLQPIVEFEMDDDGSATVTRVDAEALLRWRHPARGILGPDSFIPVAEETGLILPIGNWTLFRCAEIAERIEGTRIALNISPKQFVNDDFMDNALSMTRNNPRLRDGLRFEITESCLMDDPSRAIGRMKSLAEEGIEFSVDDFGTGFSSLAYLSRLPVGSLKIDKSFVREMTSSRQDNAIVKTVIALGREMGYGVVCEGVETYEQLVAIHAHGCSSAQGWIFGRAVPEEDFVRRKARLLSGPLSRETLLQFAVESASAVR